MKHLYEYVTAWAGKNPEKAALSDVNGTVTYGELDRRSGALAARLAALGVKPGNVVGVYVPYVKEIALGAIAAVRSGGVYMPMDSSYPKERLEFMLADSDAQALLTVRTLWKDAQLDYPEERVIFMDEESDTAPFTAVGIPENAPAFILYTSGTTGRPKGVVHGHHMMVSFLSWTSIHQGTGVTEDSRLGVMTGFTFVGSTEMFYAALKNGATACVAPEAARKDLHLLDTFIRRAGITHIFMPSGLAASYVEYFDTGSLRIFAGGEKMRNFHARSADTILVNSYGATELAGVISIRVNGDETVIPTGKLAADTDALVTDENLKPVTDGEPGELLVTNPRMALYYLNLPEQTERHFLTLDGRRWFRTGDRVVRSPEGVFTILGRTDNMVKLRGFRIETGEVEAQLTKAFSTLATDVKNLVVVLRTVNGIDHLTCYYESETEADTDAVCEEIAKSLASYMIPDLFVRVSTMPRNANGKIIRAELPQPVIRSSAPGTLYNEAEARVVSLCASVLNLKNYISPDDRFSALGGTSVKAMELAGELSRIGIFISGSDILKLDSLRKIATGAEIHYESFWTAEEYQRIRLDYASRGEQILKVLPLTPEQDELLFEQILHPDNPKLRKVYMLDIASELQEQELHEIVDQLAEEDEGLRASIVFHGVTSFQQVITDRKIPVTLKEFPDRDGLRHFYNQLHCRPADLQSDSMVRIVSARCQGITYLLFLNHMAGINMEADRRRLRRILELLAERHPEDRSISDWIEMLSIIKKSKTETKKNEGTMPALADRIETEHPELPPVHSYSSGHGKQIVFVHTGNTGSEAYFNLAERIKKDYSFAVIEPFNLYHPEEATYGISNIAERYVRFLKEYQPQGPYVLGGWCYGGIIAHEMASQLQAAGEQVECLFMLDSHVIDEEETRDAAVRMQRGVDREYFETAELFEGMKRRGMLENLIENSAHVSQDLLAYRPSHYDGLCCYFRPKTIPMASIGADSEEYWRKMTYEHDAGGFENYLNHEKLVIRETPHEHDLMMDDPSLDIIVPEMYRILK